MSRHPKLRPKTHIPGYSDGMYEFAAGTAYSDFDYSQGSLEEKREQRIFRVKRKHVLKACDRCRVKKTKCDGKQPCNRCSTHNHPCLFRERKATQTKVYSRGFVEMLESHHSLVVKALQKLYKHCVNKEGFPGEPLVEAADGHPLTHAILDRLGLIKQAEENPDDPDEDTEDLRYLRLLSTSTDSSATTTDPSPEPVTPSEPIQSNCNTVSSSPGFIHHDNNNDNDNGNSDNNDNTWKWEWEFQSAQREQQYHDYQDSSSYHGMMMSRPSFMETTGLPPEVPCPAQLVPLVLSQNQAYPYYLDSSCDGSSTKNRLHPGMTPGPSTHQVAAGLPVENMHIVGGEYHIPFQEQQQFYSAPPGNACSYWTFTSG